MLTINKLLSKGHGLAPALLKRATAVELDWNSRRQHCFNAVDSTGRSLAIALPEGSVVRGGDVLVAEDGSLIRVIAAEQPVLTVRPCSEHGSPVDLQRAAFHLGAKHAAVELGDGQLKIEPHAELAALLRRMHLTVSEALAPFDPEQGEPTAQEHGDHHHHPHALGHLHDGQASAPPRGRAVPIAVTSAPHVHGPGCGHDHDH